jgi:imidazoleglycerol-phosphate dehydratase
MKRKAQLTRKTKETEIKVRWKLDGQGKYSISTGIPFFNHMLELFARHGFFDLEIEARGDTEVDPHHTVEDVGIALGRALKDALANFEGIRRYGHAVVPMDEALCSVAIDVSGRPYLAWNGEISGRVGTFDTEVTKEFFLAFVREARVCLHVNLHYGENAHHRIESVFKGFGRALRDACAKDEYLKGVLSTKGVL